MERARHLATSILWAHLIRDETDDRAHRDDVLINPVKHGLVKRVVGWPYSTSHRWLKLGVYPADWDWRCRKRVGL
ncbi:hypothetical protein [Nitrosomonas nitrosa]|uniref:hypothetical protein n=1 Tax=Nitrosomonas nitrosa TaxID=52442 RepID=UPI0011B1D37E|nr:hypothetical protein [Nitrosomonas nitrosa]